MIDASPLRPYLTSFREIIEEYAEDVFVHQKIPASAESAPPERIDEFLLLFNTSWGHHLYLAGFLAPFLIAESGVLEEANERYEQGHTDYHYSPQLSYGMFSRLLVIPPRATTNLVLRDACRSMQRAFWRARPHSIRAVKEHRAAVKELFGGADEEELFHVDNSANGRWLDNKFGADGFAFDLRLRSQLTAVERVQRDYRVGVDWLLMDTLEKAEAAFGEQVVMDAAFLAAFDPLMRAFAFAHVYAFYDAILREAPCVAAQLEGGDRIDATPYWRERFPETFRSVLDSLEPPLRPEPQDYALIELWEREGRAACRREHPFWLSPDPGETPDFAEPPIFS